MPHYFENSKPRNQNFRKFAVRSAGLWAASSIFVSLPLFAQVGNPAILLGMLFVFGLFSMVMSLPTTLLLWKWGDGLFRGVVIGMAGGFITLIPFYPIMLYFMSPTLFFLGLIAGMFCGFARTAFSSNRDPMKTLNGQAISVGIATGLAFWMMRYGLGGMMRGAARDLAGAGVLNMIMLLLGLLGSAGSGFAAGRMARARGAVHGLVTGLMAGMLGWLLTFSVNYLGGRNHLNDFFMRPLGFLIVDLGWSAVAVMLAVIGGRLGAGPWFARKVN